MMDSAFKMMFAHDGSLQLGANVGVALGPLGRALEADFGASVGSVAPIYTYSLSKGLYAGVSLDGKELLYVINHNINEKFYDRSVSGEELVIFTAIILIVKTCWGDGTRWGRRKLSAFVVSRKQQGTK
jgi:lipid-binding SYLF domain-containing protein